MDAWCCLVRSQCLLGLHQGLVPSHHEPASKAGRVTWGGLARGGGASEAQRAPACVLSLLVRSILHTASSRVKARRLCWAIDGACVVAGRVDAVDRREAGRCIIRRGAMRVREQGRRRRGAIASALMSTGARRHRCARTRSHRHAEVEQVFERTRARTGRRPEGHRERELRGQGRLCTCGCRGRSVCGMCVCAGLLFTWPSLQGASARRRDDSHAAGRSIECRAASAQIRRHSRGTADGAASPHLIARSPLDAAR